MVPQPLSYQLNPLVLDQAAPVPLTLTVPFAIAPTSVKIHLSALNSDLTLSADVSGKVFSVQIPAAALLTGLTAADVNRRLLGQLQVTAGAETQNYWAFGDVLTAAVPAAPVVAVAADLQRTDHLVNLHFPALADGFADVQLQLPAIAQKFYSHFDDDYDFLQIVFARAHFENRYHFVTRNDVLGIGHQLFNIAAQYGSAGRLIGVTIFPIPTLFDGGAPTTLHEIGHQWIDYLKFAPFLPGVPHWPLSDLASDIMGFSIDLNGQPEGGQFDFDLVPQGNGNYKMVPSAALKGFSDLSLYLMGMRPAAQVGSHFVFDNQAQTVVANGILAGPTTTVTINDVIAHAGARSPDFAHSQKRFRVATLLVTKEGLASPQALRLYDFFSARAGATAPLAYSEGFIHGTSQPFRVVTHGIGRLDPRIKRHILIDASRDGGVWWFPQHGPFVAGAPHQGKALADHLRSLGHQVTELPRPTTVTAALLADFDLAVRVAGTGAYTAAEIAAYDQWVKDGGGLLLLAEHHPHDALAQHFGLQFQGIARGPQTLATFVPHPLTQGVGPLPYPAGSGLTAHPAAATILGRLAGATFLDLDDDGVKDPGEPAAPAALGVLPFGQGRIVFCGDANLWENVPQPLVRNTLRYLSAP